MQFSDGYFPVAPTDEAFANLPNGTLEVLVQPENLDLLADILLYHVIIFRQILSSQLNDGDQLPTMIGQNVTISSVGSDIFVNNAKIVAPDILAVNGVIHGIDAVLIPQIILPVPMADIVDLAVSSGFDTFVEAVRLADLVSALKALVPRKTVFAPTDEAFAALPDQVLSYLTSAVGKNDLVDILLYHVVGEELVAAELITRGSVETLANQEVSIAVSGEDIVVGSSTVIQADVMATNGVIHVIDGMCSST